MAARTAAGEKVDDDAEVGFPDDDEELGRPFDWQEDE